MPYIRKELRGPIDIELQDLNYAVNGPGDLNYAITRLVAMYMGAPTYAKINEAVGILECVKLELYRRLATPYENQKKIDNGDIPEYSG